MSLSDKEFCTIADTIDSCVDSINSCRNDLGLIRGIVERVLLGYGPIRTAKTAAHPAKPRILVKVDLKRDASAGDLAAAHQTAEGYRKAIRYALHESNAITKALKLDLSDVPIEICIVTAD